MAAKKKDSKTKRILMAILRYTVASLSMGIVLYMLFALFFSTKEERALERENRLYSNLYMYHCSVLHGIDKKETVGIIPPFFLLLY